MANYKPQTIMKDSIKYQFEAANDINFERVIANREDSTLTEDAKQNVISLYKDVNLAMREYGLKYARASFNLLVMLKEESTKASRRERRDDTSAYIHEIAQATYNLWIFENRASITKWLHTRTGQSRKLHPNLRSGTKLTDHRDENRLLMTPMELDIAMAIAFNHDSMEDLGLSPNRFKRFLMSVDKRVSTMMYANDNGRVAYIISSIVQGVVNLSKKPNDKKHAWMNRAKKNDIALLAKSIDRMHNLATIIGSDRNESKIRAYIADTREFLERSAPLLRKNGTTTYVGQYLYDQCELLELYFDVKNKKAYLSVLEKKANELVEEYDVNSVHRSIHPMLCTVGRAMTDILHSREPNLVAGQSAQQRGGHARPKLAS